MVKENGATRPVEAITAPKPDLHKRCTAFLRKIGAGCSCSACTKELEMFVEAEVTLLEQRDTEWQQAVSIGIGASWISVSEAPTFASRVSDDIADMVRRHDVALRTQRDRADQKIDELNLSLVGARRERDEARDALLRYCASHCEVNAALERERNEAREELAEAERKLSLWNEIARLRRGNPPAEEGKT